MKKSFLKAFIITYFAVSSLSYSKTQDTKPKTPSDPENRIEKIGEEIKELGEKLREIEKEVAEKVEQKKEDVSKEIEETKETASDLVTKSLDEIANQLDTLEKKLRKYTKEKKKKKSL